MKSQTVKEFIVDLGTLPGRLQDRAAEALVDCEPIILEAVAENFARSRTAAGDPWPARKDPRPTHPLLILDGDLLRAATGGDVRRVNRDSLELGVSKDTIIYAGVHQYGWPEGNVAQREYMAISNATVDQCVETIAAAVAEEAVQ
jgi:phage gpG-like protein